MRCQLQIESGCRLHRRWVLGVCIFSFQKQIDVVKAASPDSQIAATIEGAAVQVSREFLYGDSVFGKFCTQLDVTRLDLLIRHRKMPVIYSYGPSATGCPDCASDAKVSARGSCHFQPWSD